MTWWLSKEKRDKFRFQLEVIICRNWCHTCASGFFLHHKSVSTDQIYLWIWSLVLQMVWPSSISKVGREFSRLPNQTWADHLFVGCMFYTYFGISDVCAEAHNKTPFDQNAFNQFITCSVTTTLNSCFLKTALNSLTKLYSKWYRKIGKVIYYIYL